MVRPSPREAASTADSSTESGAVSDLAQLVAQSRELLCIVDFDGRVLQVNPACLTILGVTPEELRGKRLLEWVHEEDRAEYLVARALKAGASSELTFVDRYRHRNGSVRWLTWSARSNVEERRIHAAARD